MERGVNRRNKTERDIIIVRLLVNCYDIYVKMSIQYELLWKYCSTRTVMPIKHVELN